jgi:hypothetical protein
MTTLPLWAYDSDLSYVVAEPSEVPALKTFQVWNSVRTTALDPNAVHVQDGIRQLVSHQRDRLAGQTYNKMIKKLRDNPPRIIVFDYQTPNDLAAVDKIRMPDTIFIRRGLVSALEMLVCQMKNLCTTHRPVTTLYSWQLGDPPTIHHSFDFLP